MSPGQLQGPGDALMGGEGRWPSSERGLHRQGLRLKQLPPHIICWQMAICAIEQAFCLCISSFPPNHLTSHVQKYLFFHQKNNTGVPPTATTTSRARRSTALHEFLTPEERAGQIQRWGEIRAMTKDEAAASLNAEDLELYNNYYAEVREGVLKMQELAKLMMEDVDKAKGVEPKTKGQRRRDMWAKKQARAAANAAACVLSTSAPACHET